MFGAATCRGPAGYSFESIAAQAAATRLTGPRSWTPAPSSGRADRLTAVAMHSATEAALRSLTDRLIRTRGKAQIRVFQGRAWWWMTTCRLGPGLLTAGLHSYLFGQGAFAKGRRCWMTPLQGGFGQRRGIARAALDSDTNLINRRRLHPHPRGVKFTSASVAADSPTMRSWRTRRIGSAWEAKNVRIVAVT